MHHTVHITKGNLQNDWGKAPTVLISKATLILFPWGALKITMVTSLDLSQSCILNSSRTRPLRERERMTPLNTSNSVSFASPSISCCSTIKHIKCSSPIIQIGLFSWFSHVHTFICLTWVDVPVLPFLLFVSFYFASQKKQDDITWKVFTYNKYNYII